MDFFRRRWRANACVTCPVLRESAGPTCEAVRASTGWLLVPASAADQRTAALSEGPERLRGRDRRAQLVVVPGMLRLVGPLHLEQMHVVNLAAVGTNAALTEQRVVRRHVLHLGHHRFAVSGTADRDDRLEVVPHRRVD